MFITADLAMPRFGAAIRNTVERTIKEVLECYFAGVLIFTKAPSIKFACQTYTSPEFDPSYKTL